jgi:DNA-directed RNA polymerase specialized sigma24 family protein
VPLSSSLSDRPIARCLTPWTADGGVRAVSLPRPRCLVEGRVLNSPPLKSNGALRRSYPEDSINAGYAQIARICFVAGLRATDAEDLAQEVWLWLLRAGVPLAMIGTPWFEGAIRNYVRRYRRRDYRQQDREGRSLESVPEPPSSEPSLALEIGELLDRVSAILPRREKAVLALIRGGYTLAEASRELGIPRGSRSYRGEQLVAYARRVASRPGWPQHPLGRSALE